MADAIYGQLAGLLNTFGLGSLLSTDADGNPSGWLADQIRQGVDTPEELWIAIESTDVFRERYGVIMAQRQARARGENVAVMSPAEVMANEAAFAQKAAYYGLPRGTYDSYKDFQGYMMRGITPEQFEQSALRSWQRVNEAPAEVRQVFGEWYGPQGDSMLTAYFLDPEHVTANVERITSTAVAGGYARHYGFNLAQEKAYELAGRSLSDDRLAQGFSRIQQQQDLFRETQAEQTDLQAGVEGVQAEFDLSGDAATQLQRRVAERSAAFAGGQGGGALTRQGVYGLGSAE